MNNPIDERKVLMEYEQLTIFDIFAELDHHEQIPYQTGDEIVIIANHLAEDIESKYYLEPYIKKAGQIQQVFLNPRIHYEVLIGKKIIMVYHEEVRGSCIP